MPCRYDPSPAEIEEGQRRAVARAVAEDPKVNALSVRVDYLQDLIYRLAMDEDVSEDEVRKVLDEQDRHRQDDLDRLAKVFAGDLKKYKSKLKKVLEADPTKPLEPQLGFDPDKF